MIAPGVAAGGYPGTLESLPPAAAPGLQPGAAHHAEAQGPAVAQGELLQADRRSPSDVHQFAARIPRFMTQA